MTAVIAGFRPAALECVTLVIVSGEAKRWATYIRANACVWRTAAVYPHTVRDAREWARGQLADLQLSEEVIGDAVLIVSELLTAVLRQAPGEAELTLLVEENLLTITCADRDGSPARSGGLDRDSPLGRGLALVDLLARGCFVRRRSGGGKRVVVLLPTARDERGGTE